MMTRFDGSAARQLDLIDIDERDRRLAPPKGPEKPAARLRVLQKDLYAELTRRRRRAQIAARHTLDQA